MLGYYLGIEDIALRSGLSFFFTFSLSLLIYPKFISLLQKLSFGQEVRDNGPKSHHKKQGTPTAGGVVIIGLLLLSIFLFGDLSSYNLSLLIFSTIGFFYIGLKDDYKKIKEKSSAGISAKFKYVLQSIFAIIALYMISLEVHTTAVFIPFVNTYLHLPAFLYYTLGYFVIMASSNAVNLTDGLDGLVSVPLVVMFFALMLITTLSIGENFYQYKLLQNKDAVEFIVYSAAAIGSLLGFYWFNAHPAKIFMGDAGSLALGGVIGVIVVMLNIELVFFFMALVFVLEALSVILQVASFKLRGGKRIFRMAPIHHHFELCGLAETTVVTRFHIASIVCAAIGLSLLFI